MILIEDTIVADDGNIFRLRLGDQHSVEWIAVLSRESSSAQRMFDRDWQGIDSQLCEIKGKVTDEFLPRRQLAQTNFGAISQADTALNRISLAPSSMRRRARVLREVDPLNDQSSV